MAEVDEDALAAIRAKFVRAHEQLQALDVELDLWTHRHRNTFGVPKPNADRTEWVVPLKLPEPFPLRWGVILGEIVHDIRSALDHTIYQLTIDWSKDAFERTGFPISKKSRGWDERATHRITADNPLGFHPWTAMYQLRGVSPQVVDYVKRNQPHAATNPQASALLGLQELWNQDKHRLLHFWGLLVNEDESEFVVNGATCAYTVEWATGVVEDDGDVATLKFDGPNERGQLQGHLAMHIAFDNPADPGPGTHDPLWQLYDAAVGVGHTLLAAVRHQDEPIP